MRPVLKLEDVIPKVYNFILTNSIDFPSLFYIYPKSLSTEFSPTPDVLKEQGNKAKIEVNRLLLY